MAPAVCEVLKEPAKKDNDYISIEGATDFDQFSGKRTADEDGLPETVFSEIESRISSRLQSSNNQATI